MKFLTKIQALFLSIAMLLCVTSGVAYAAEAPQTEGETYVATYDFEITPDMREGVLALERANVDNTFNVYGSHTGSTRQYYGSKLKYTVTITDANGRSADNILAIRLCQPGGSIVNESQFWADGAGHLVTGLPISSGGSYYFQYIQAYGNLRTLRVRMVITAYN